MKEFNAIEHQRKGKQYNTFPDQNFVFKCIRKQPTEQSSGQMLTNILVKSSFS